MYLYATRTTSPTPIQQRWCYESSPMQSSDTYYTCCIPDHSMFSCVQSSASGGFELVHQAAPNVRLPRTRHFCARRARGGNSQRLAKSSPYAGPSVGT